MLGGAKLVLSVLGESEATEITLDDVSDTARIFSQARFNGDGIVPAKSAEDPALAAVIGDIIGCLGGESDRGGEPGVTAEAIERFYTEAQGDRGLVGGGREAGDPSVRGRDGVAVRTLPLFEAQGRGLFPAMPAGGVRRPVGDAARPRGSRLSESGRDDVAGGHGSGCGISARGGGGRENVAPGGGVEPRVRRRGAAVRDGDRPAGPGRRGIASGRRVGNDLRALRALRSVAGNETGDGGVDPRRGAGADDPRGGRQGGSCWISSHGTRRWSRR